MPDSEVTGTLTSGGTFHATPWMIEVTYPDGERPPVTIDLDEVAGVQRSGNEVTLIRRDERQVGLRTVSVAEAGQLAALVRGVVEARQPVDFDREIARLHAQGYRLIAATPRVAQMVRPKTFSYFIASLLLLLFVLPAIIYVFYYLSNHDRTALVMIDGTGRVVTVMSES